MTIKDIAKLCNTSVATVSRVINNDPKVADATRQKVLEVIKEQKFVPNITGRNLRTQKSMKILVLLPTMANQFYARILQGIDEKAEEFGYDMLVAVTNQDEAQESKYLDMLRMKTVDGCISFFNTLSANKITSLARDYPFVQCCEPTLYANVSSVVVNNRQAIYETCLEFIKEGHKRIAMISGDYYKYSEQCRENGYKEALIENGIEVDDTLIIKNFYRYKDGSDATKTLMNLENPPTAIICASDSLALGAISELKNFGKVVGEDVKVIGFDNTSITEYFCPTISSIAQPRFDLGQEAFKLLLEKLEDNTSSYKQITLPHRIVHRESTKPRLKVFN
ncbi:LacI family DNA-binding transcriptional regulator [Mycoplasmatota bacterium WC30]